MCLFSLVRMINKNKKISSIRSKLISEGKIGSALVENRPVIIFYSISTDTCSLLDLSMYAKMYADSCEKHYSGITA